MWLFVLRIRRGDLTMTITINFCLVVLLADVINFAKVTGGVSKGFRLFQGAMSAFPIGKARDVKRELPTT